MIKKIALSLLLLVALAIVAVFLFAKDVDILISEEQVQTAIDKKIAQGPVKSRGIFISLNSASVDFKSNNTAEIIVDFDVEGFGYSSNMAGTFSTGLRYKEPKVFLANIAPIDIKTSADMETEAKLQDVKNVASDFLKRQRKDMLSDEAKKSLDNIIGHNVVQVKDLAANATYAFFETLPIYDLREGGAAGSLASLALKDVRFDEQNAIVTLSPVQALIKILTFIALSILTLWSFFGFMLPYRHRESLSEEQV